MTVDIDISCGHGECPAYVTKIDRSLDGPMATPACCWKHRDTKLSKKNMYTIQQNVLVEEMHVPPGFSQAQHFKKCLTIDIGNSCGHENVLHMSKFYTV